MIWHTAADDESEDTVACEMTAPTPFDIPPPQPTVRHIAVQVASFIKHLDYLVRNYIYLFTPDEKLARALIYI